MVRLAELVLGAGAAGAASGWPRRADVRSARLRRGHDATRRGHPRRLRRPGLPGADRGTARDALFGCCNDEQAAWAASRLGPQPVVPFAQPIRVDEAGADAFASLPRAYVMATQDRAIPVAMQRLMVAANGCDPVLELDTDHSPWLSRTGELVAMLDQLAVG